MHPKAVNVEADRILKQPSSLGGFVSAWLVAGIPVLADVSNHADGFFLKGASFGHELARTGAAIV